MIAPSSWKEITIRQFIRVNEVIKAEYQDAVEQQVALIAAVTGRAEEEILHMDRSELMAWVKDLAFLQSGDSISTKWPKWFMVKGRLFKPVQNVQKLTAGQYIDLITFSKDPMANLHKVLATLCLPVKTNIFGPGGPWKWLRPQKYDGRKHEELSAFFYEHLTMDIAYPIALFFCNLWEAFMPSILTFLETEIRNLTRELAKETIMSSDGMEEMDSSKPMAGSTPSISLPEGTGLNGSSTRL